MPFGKFRGEPISRVPSDYLQYSVEHNYAWAKPAQAELERRKVEYNVVRITGHAIDRASIRLLSQFFERPDQMEGLHKWIARMSETALAEVGHIDENGKVIHQGIVWVFEIGMAAPVLKTCWLEEKPQEE